MQIFTTMRRGAGQFNYLSRMANQRIDQNAVRTRIRLLVAECADGKQDEFADKVKIDAGMISKLLSGREFITRRYLGKIEKGTGARLTWLEWGILPQYYENKQAPDRPEIELFEGYLLRKYLDEHNIEYAELGRRLGKTKNTVGGYFKTESFSKNNREAILNALGATYEDVFGSKPLVERSFNRPERIELYDDNDEELVDVVDVPIAARAGFGYQAFIQGIDKTYTKIPRHMLRPGVRAKDHCLVEVNGDSMEPDLRAGYKMLAYKMQPGSWPRLQSIVMVDYRDELIIKELAAIDDVNHTVLLRSRNGGATRHVSMSEIRSVHHVYRYFDAQLP